MGARGVWIFGSALRDGREAQLMKKQYFIRNTWTGYICDNGKMYRTKRGVIRAYRNLMRGPLAFPGMLEIRRVL